MIIPENDAKLIRCGGCNTWQHSRGGRCPRCGEFITEEGRRKEEERKRKKAARAERIAREAARKAAYKAAREAAREAREAARRNVDLDEVKWDPSFEWSIDQLEIAKATLAGFKEKEAARRRSISESKKGAEEAAMRSEELSKLCISKYGQGKEIPPAATMTRMLYQETGIVLDTSVLVRHLRQFGYKRILGSWWRKVDA